MSNREIADTLLLSQIDAMLSEDDTPEPSEGPDPGEFIYLTSLRGDN